MPAYYGVDANNFKHEAFELNSDGDLVPTKYFIIEDPNFQLADNLTDLTLKTSMYFKLSKEVENLSDDEIEDLLVF
jgi:hypothetical protein